MYRHYEDRIQIQNALVPAIASNLLHSVIFELLQFSLRLDLVQCPQVRSCAQNGERYARSEYSG